MSQTADDILKQALQLSPSDRLTVAQELWDSVDPYPKSPIVIDDALMAEIDRRDAEMDAGNVLTYEEMLAEIEQLRGASQKACSDIRRWPLWQPGAVEGELEGISPLLASWEKGSHPAQVRLRAYLDDLVGRMLPLPEEGPLFLRLEVDVGEPQRLSRHYDLENYLTPLFGSKYLPATRFVLVTAKKYVGGGSRITWGKAIPAVLPPDTEWTSFSINAGRDATQKSWKERIRAALAESGAAAVPPGPASVKLAWRCAARRNWCAYWKPTGDAMGPVLGVSNPLKPYHLDDDRIVDLELHRIVDDTLRNDVEVGMWWSAVQAVGERCNGN